MPLIGHLMCFMRQQISQAYTDLGYSITPEAADALMIIQHFDGLPQKDLAQILGKDKASVTRLLNNLVHLKLVERIQDGQDRRIIRACITPQGKEVFEQFLPKLQALSDHMLQHIPDAAFNQACDTLTHMSNNAQSLCGNNR